MKRMRIASALVLAAALAGCGAHAASADSAAGGYSGSHHRGGMLRAVQRLGLTPLQKAKIQKIVDGYRAAHPQRSPRDPQAMRAERREIMNVLTPAQRSQLQH